jgi:hypothetical protein
MYAGTMLLGLANPWPSWYNGTPLYYIVILVKWRDNERDAKVVIGFASTTVVFKEEKTLL